MKVAIQGVILLMCLGVIFCARRAAISRETANGRRKVLPERHRPVVRGVLKGRVPSLNRRYSGPKVEKIQAKHSAGRVVDSVPHPRNVTMDTASAVEGNSSGRYECGDVVTCFQLDLLRNLSDISKGGDVSLTTGLFLDRVEGKIALPRKELTVEEVERRLSEGLDVEDGYLSRVLADKTMEVMETHSLRWNLVPGFDFRMYKNGDDLDAAVVIQGLDSGARTFGIGPRKRLMMALLPVMYKLGVMTTMLGALIVLALKGLAIGVILLVLAAGNLLGKLKMGHGHGWGWQDDHHHGPRPIHVHVHTGGGGDKHAYSGWHSASGPEFPVQYHHHPEVQYHHDRVYQPGPEAQYPKIFR